MMRKRLPNKDAFAINHHTNEPVTGPLEIRYRCMLELSVTIWTDDQQVTGVMANVWVEMVYFKVRFAVPFFECERTKLTLPMVHFSKQDANCRGYTLVALGRTRKYLRPWLAW